MDERREHPRFRVVATVEVEDAGQRSVRSGTMHDVSLGGAYIEMESPPPQGSRLHVLVMRADEAPMSLPATVVRHAGEGDMGIAWDDLAEDEQRSVQSLVGEAEKST